MYAISVDNFFEDCMQDGQLIRPEKLDIEFSLAQIVEGVKAEAECVLIGYSDFFFNANDELSCILLT